MIGMLYRYYNNYSLFTFNRFDARLKISRLLDSESQTYQPMFFHNELWVNKPQWSCCTFAPYRNRSSVALSAYPSIMRSIKHVYRLLCCIYEHSLIRTKDIRTRNRMKKFHHASSQRSMRSYSYTRIVVDASLMTCDCMPRQPAHKKDSPYSINLRARAHTYYYYMPWVICIQKKSYALFIRRAHEH